MSLGAVGTCGNDPCGQTELLAEDGYCSADCREHATGCEVPGCRCGGGLGDQPPPPDRAP